MKQFIRPEWQPDQIEFKMVAPQKDTEYQEGEFENYESDEDETEHQNNLDQVEEEPSDKINEVEQDLSETGSKPKTDTPVQIIKTKAQQNSVKKRKESPTTTTAVSTTESSREDKSSSDSQPTKVSEGISTLTNNSGNQENRETDQLLPQFHLRPNSQPYYPPMINNPYLHPPQNLGPYGSIGNPQITVPTLEQSLPTPVVNSILAIHL